MSRVDLRNLEDALEEVDRHVLVFNEATDRDGVPMSWRDERGEPCFNQAGERQPCDCQDSEMGMPGPLDPLVTDGPLPGDADYDMIPPSARDFISNASPVLLGSFAQRVGEGGGTNPAGQYGSAPRVVHSVSELMGEDGDDEDSEMDNVGVVTPGGLNKLYQDYGEAENRRRLGLG